MFFWYFRLCFALFSVCFGRCLRGVSMWCVFADFGAFVSMFLCLDKLWFYMVKGGLVFCVLLLVCVFVYVLGQCNV